jgi:hypothetical protein
MVVSGIQDSGNNITSTDYKNLGNCLVLCELPGSVRTGWHKDLFSGTALSYHFLIVLP